MVEAVGVEAFLEDRLDAFFRVEWGGTGEFVAGFQLGQVCRRESRQVRGRIGFGGR